jgi:hypothetical protein
MGLLLESRQRRRSPQKQVALEAYEITPLHHYEPGYVRILSIPKPECLTRTLAAASPASYATRPGS